MKRTLIYIFLNGFADYKTHRSIVETDNVKMITIAVKNYEQACIVAKEYAQLGAVAIELCGAFGNIGVGKVTEAVGGKTKVGVIRFDNHPGFDGESGDQRFL